jgi:hypothetical protein
MQITIDLDNPADVRAAIEILPRYLPSDPSRGGGSIEERFLNDLWLRLGKALRRLVKEVQQHHAPLTIEALASRLGRPAASVKASLNGPLARAIKSAKQAVPGAPELFVWTHNGAVYEMDLTDSMRAALAARSVENDFEAIPDVDAV